VAEADGRGVGVTRGAAVGPVLGVAAGVGGGVAPGVEAGAGAGVARGTGVGPSGDDSPDDATAASAPDGDAETTADADGPPGDWDAPPARDGDDEVGASDGNEMPPRASTNVVEAAIAATSTIAAMTTGRENLRCGSAIVAARIEPRRNRGQSTWPAVRHTSSCWRSD
jgi:hypothetical protein